MRAFVSRTVLVAALLTCLRGIAAAQEARVPPSGEVEDLRREIEALRREYGERLAALEARLAALAPVPPESKPAEPQPPPPSPAAPTEAVPPGATGAGGPSGTLPVYGPVTSKVFNPDIGVIGDFLGAAGRNEIDPQPSLELHEAEASFQAIVDPYARADFFLAFGPEGAEVEEGFITFPTLPGDFLMKVGKLKASFGKVNTLHNHLLPWTDRPLVTRNLVGGEEGISDAGVSLSRLFPNRFVFLEATGEVYRGQSEVFAAPDRDDLTWVGRVRAYRDLTEASNLDLGASLAYGHNDAGPDLKTRLLGLDATFRYRPLRRAIYRRLIGRTELVWSRREEQEGTRNAFGTYVAGEYQFARRWFAGARFDYSERADASVNDKGASLLLTYWPSEFSQVRGQLRRIRYGEGRTENELLFQFLFSIGAHGAHPF